VVKVPGRSQHDSAMRRPDAPTTHGVLQRTAIVGEAANQVIPSIVDEVVGSPGKPLDQPIRAYMEPRFGHDFSQVRVHADENAHRSAAVVNARAYTVGQHIVMGRDLPGAWSPEGQTIVAHELVHVVQQEEHHANKAPAVHAIRISDPDDTHELQAAAEAQRVLHRQPDSVFEPTRSVRAPSRTLHRQNVTPNVPATFEDTLQFIVNEAGFAQGSATPPNVATYSGKDARAFGTVTHNDQLKAAVTRAQQLGYPGARRLVEGVRVNGSTGEVIGINVPPGGKTGDLNFDLVAQKEGHTIALGDKLQHVATTTFDAKYGRLTTNKEQAAFARRHGLAHIDLGAGNFRLRVAVPPGAPSPAQGPVASAASAAKPAVKKPKGVSVPTPAPGASQLVGKAAPLAETGGTPAVAPGTGVAKAIQGGAMPAAGSGETFATVSKPIVGPPDPLAPAVPPKTIAGPVEAKVIVGPPKEFPHATAPKASPELVIPKPVVEPPVQKVALPPPRVAGPSPLRMALKGGLKAGAWAVAFLGLDYWVRSRLTSELESSIALARPHITKWATRMKTKNPGQPVYIRIVIHGRDSQKFIPFLGWMPNPPELFLAAIGVTETPVDPPSIITEEVLNWNYASTTTSITYTEQVYD
jgi:hypothetical protein